MTEQKGGGIKFKTKGIAIMNFEEVLHFLKDYIFYSVTASRLNSQSQPVCLAAI